MKLLYTIYQSLDYLKKQIEEAEEHLKGKGRWERASQINHIQWLFERALAIIKLVKQPDKDEKEMVEWFLSKKPRRARPDIKKAKEIME